MTKHGNVPRLGVDDDVHRDLLDDELPEVCRLCETGAERLRIPGQFLCEECALDKWGREDLVDVLERTRDVHNLDP